MNRRDWVWMGHAAHFICGDRCSFHLATYVGGYIVSTVGELVVHGQEEFEEIGYKKLYETMVFRAKPSENVCCPYTIADLQEVVARGYNDADSATRGHMELCDEWEGEA